MDAGSAGHAALAAWLRGENWMDAIEYYREYTAEHNMVDDRRGYDNMVNVLDTVIHRHPLPQLPFVVDDPAYIEVPFACPLGSVEVGGEKVDVNLIGVMDGAPKDRRSGKRWVLEHKFTGQLNEAFIWRFVNFDPQTTAYIWAVQKTLDESVQDCWVNAVSMTMMPTSERKCAAHGVQYLECGPMHVKQTFISVRRTPEQLQEFQVNALRVAKEAVQAAQFAERAGALAATKSPRIGPFTSACEYCDFKRWCLTSNRQPAMMETLLYKPEVDSERLRSGFVNA
jgi:hypothetical protein